MKKIKKILAAVMTLAMVLGMSMTTFAADETATITVDNLNKEATITYLQVVEPDTTSPQGWKFSSTEIATAFKTAFSVSSDAEALDALFTLGEGENTPNINAQNGTINTSADLSEALTALQNNANNTLGVTGNKISVNKGGLYLIVATPNNAEYRYIPMLAYVKVNADGTLVNATVTAKGSHNVIDKNLDSANVDGSVSAGDEVEYTATVTYPYYSVDTTSKTFTATDNLTNGTFKENSLVITVDGVSTPLQVGNDYTVNEYAGKSELNISFNYNTAYASKTVTIKYTAIVGEGEGNLVNAISTNFDTDGDTVTSSKVKVKVLKTGEDSLPLTGATFAIYEVSQTQANGFTKYENISVVGEKEPVTVWLKQVDTNRTTEGADGSLTFVGLDADKTYYVKETNAPSGYTVNPNYYLISGAEKDDLKSSDDLFVYTDFDDVTVDNDTLSSLPSTGGIGTTIFTIGGCIIMIAAAGLFFASRRKSSK